ncbi:MAG: HAMP domain-containing histidine kinase [Oscillospiraceae bacterium]|nr:HAMP domain-containing histidine kinase [Oscillospiraceae bacterium]MBQ1768580.1 HAMP domain-containing histidine kinase [Oscillospiraceae bacterium]MBQ3985609.1 HAMP domain-containing histidine kinase [Oscillospiraceae bacterium]
MKLLRNPEIKRELFIYAAATVIFAAAGFFVSPLCGALILALGACLSLLHLLLARKRYAEMEKLAESIDRALHGQETALIGDEAEGELGILKSEIRKLFSRLSEQKDLLSAEKIRLTEAIQDIFHQLRTPLTSMGIVTSLLEDEDLTYELRVQRTRELKRQLERIEWLVETLLKLSKIDAGTAQFKKDSVSVKEAFDKAAESLIIPMELRGQTLTVKAADERFTGDLNWTAEALGNILKNSMEHTPEGGEISVEAEETALYTELRILDSGSGFDKEDIPHIFERFYKGKNAADSSVGIGLALARSIIAAQNGAISAKNGKDGGAKFTIRFYKSVI